jgi:hypothetical protein
MIVAKKQISLKKNSWLSLQIVKVRIKTCCPFLKWVVFRVTVHAVSWCYHLDEFAFLCSLACLNWIIGWHFIYYWKRSILLIWCYKWATFDHENCGFLRRWLIDRYRLKWLNVSDRHNVEYLAFSELKLFVLNCFCCNVELVCLLSFVLQR